MAPVPRVLAPVLLALVARVRVALVPVRQALGLVGLGRALLDRIPVRVGRRRVRR